MRAAYVRGRKVGTTKTNPILVPEHTKKVFTEVARHINLHEDKLCVQIRRYV